MTEDNSIIAMCQYGNSLWDNHIIDYILSFRDLKHSNVPGWPRWNRRASALARRWQGLCLWTFLIIGCILQACSFFRLASSHQELTLKKKESKMVGEQLMRLLETLDGISLGQNMLELRARRKKAAARINSLMDANDSNIQVRNSKTENFLFIFLTSSTYILSGYWISYKAEEQLMWCISYFAMTRLFWVWKAQSI